MSMRPIIKVSAEHKFTATPKKHGWRQPDIIANLNAKWRVVDDPIQWILQVRKGRKGKRTTGYRGRSYCLSRTALLRCIREYCGPVEPNALALIEALPERHK
jgi:hypothetical protein